MTVLLDPVSLLADLRQKGIAFGVEGERLKVDAPKGALSADLRALIAGHKADFLHLLRAEQAVRQINGYQPIPTVARSVPTPASFAQQRLWFLDRLEEQSHAYTIPLFLQATGELHRTALTQAVTAIIRRHAVLRTVFQEPVGEDTVPSQVILPASPLPVPLLDLADLSATVREEKVQALAHEVVQQPFDLATGPLLRLTVVCTGTETHLLLFTIHHIVFDGLSVALFLRELRTLYAAFVAGQPSPLADLEIQYADFSDWQRATLRGSKLADALAFWQKHLAGAPPLLELPLDHPRPPIQTFRGARQRFLLDPELTARLRNRSQTQDATLFMTLYAAFAALLVRYTGQNDLVIGVPVANRNHPQLEPLIGLFVNTLAMRCQVEGEMRFSDLLQQVKATALQAYRHQDLPFEQLINELNVERSLGHNPLVQVMFSLQDKHTEGFTLPDLTIAPYPFADTVAKFDLTLIIHEGTETLTGIFEYNTDLFDHTTIERMIMHWQTLLQGIVAHPTTAIAHLPLLTANEKHQLLVDWNDTAVAYPQEHCLHQLFEAQVARTPDAVAAMFDRMTSWQDDKLKDASLHPVIPSSSHPVTLTYAELNARANQLAHYLQTIGVGPDVLVGLCVERSLEMIVGLLGILKAGGAYVPLDPAYPPERLAFILQDAATSVLLTNAPLLEQLPVTSAHIICLDRDWPAIAQQNNDNPRSNSQADQLAYIIYTSGSTGQPKGSLNAHRGVCNLLHYLQDAHPLTPNDKTLQSTVVSFDVATSEIFWPLLNGASLVLPQPQGARDSAYLVAMMQSYAITTLHLVPTLLQLLLEEPAMTACTTLKRIIAAGETLPVALQARCVARLPHVALHNLYGPTETAIYVTAWRCHAQPERMSVPIGRPIANTQIYVLDQQLQPVPIGVAGELHIGGVQVGHGYLNRPKLTTAKFIANPFGAGQLYKTGDLARWLPDGSIDCLGRIDHQVKIRGFRIELGEIEAVLAQHPAVQEAVVSAREERPDEKRLVAYVTYVTYVTLSSPPAEGTTVLRDWLKARLPDYMLPAAYVVLEALPLSPNGKIDRKALPAPNTTNRHANYIPPRNSVELRLVQCWEKLLEIAPISVQDNFFELGGDSLLAIRLVAQIRQTFHMNFPLQALFQHTTIEQLGDLLRRQAASIQWSPLVCLQAEGDRTPFFFVHAAGGIVFRYLQVAALLGRERPFYGLQARGIEPGAPFYATIEEMAADYVAAMRQVQPHGPYLLGGWSFGGTVAFEMARLLEQAGETAPIIIMVDAASPFVESFAEDAIEFMVERMRPAAGLALDQLDLHHSREAQLAYLFHEQRLAGLFAPDIDDAYAQHRLNLHRHHNKIMTQYRPAGPINGKIIFFKASEAIPFDTRMKEPTVDWARFALGGIEVHDAPGNHFNMFSTDNGPVLAQKIKPCIADFA